MWYFRKRRTGRMRFFYLSLAMIVWPLRGQRDLRADNVPH